MSQPTNQSFPSLNRLRPIFASPRFVLPVLIAATVIPTALLWNKAAYTTGDSYMFMRAGMNLVRGRGYTGMDGAFMYVQDRPLYPITIGLASFVTSHVETAARLISLLGAALAVVAFYWLVKQRHSQAVAIMSAAVFALLPLRVWSGQWILTDGLALGLILTGVAFLFAKQTPGRSNALVAGLLIGLAYLTRSEALLLCMGGCAYLLLFANSPDFKRRTVTTCLFLLGFTLMAAPHHLWLYEHTGTFTPHRLVDNLFASEALYQGWPMPFDVHFDESTMRFVKAVPNLTFAAISKRYAFFAKQELARLIYLPGPRFLTVPLLIVGGIAFFRDLSKRKTDALWQALLLSPLLVFPLFRIEDRYLLPALPVLCLWMVSGALTIGKWLNKQLERSQTRVAVKPVWVCSVFIALLLGGYIYRLSTLLPHAHATVLPQQAAVWMQAARLPEGKIIAQEPALAFYKGADQVWLPYGPLEHVLRYARQHQARYVFVSSNDAANPLKDRLLADGEPPEDLLLLQRFQSKDGNAKLFELAPEAGAPAVARR